MKKKVLVCGGTGFIGRNIVESLTRRSDVEVFATHYRSKPLNIPGVKMVCANLTNAEEVNKTVSGMDIIIQAAAVTSGAKEGVLKPHLHVTDNAVMNSLIYRAAHENGVKHVVFFSCSVMYKSNTEPLKETDFDANEEIFSTYFGVGWTKVYLEKMCEFYSSLGKTKYTVLRHSNIYGPYDKFDLERSHVFGATMTKVMLAENGGKISVWGSGEEARDLLYVSDLVDFVELSIDKQSSKFELYNLGCGVAIPVIDLVKKIILHTGKQVEIVHDLSKPTIKTSLCLDSSRAKAALGWLPRISLDEGIRKTMEWYKLNIKKS